MMQRMYPCDRGKYSRRELWNAISTVTYCVYYPGSEQFSFHVCLLNEFRTQDRKPHQKGWWAPRAAGQAWRDAGTPRGSEGLGATVPPHAWCCGVTAAELSLHFESSFFPVCGAQCCHFQLFFTADSFSIIYLFISSWMLMHWWDNVTSGTGILRK